MKEIEERPSEIRTEKASGADNINLELIKWSENIVVGNNEGSMDDYKNTKRLGINHSRTNT